MSVDVGNGADTTVSDTENALAPASSTGSNVPEPTAPGAIPMATTAEQQGISAGEEIACLTCQ